MLKQVYLIVSVLLFMSVPATATTESLASTGLSDIDIKFVEVPGGCFQMGSASGNSDEKPTHEACVADFFIAKFEVTQGQWRKVMGSNPSRFDGCGDNCPVEQISWNDAQEFIYKLNALNGKNYRLPTEAEWEYACKSGGRDGDYCGNGAIDMLAWYRGNSGGKTHPVGQKQPNRFGIFDMSGNVWEWVSDWKADYPNPRRQASPVSASVSTRVRRGGSWQYGADQSRAAWRSSGYPDDHALDLGFRLAYSPQR